MTAHWEAVAALVVSSYIALMPSRADGACAAKDIAGVWDAYSLSADEFGAYWQRCVIRFNARGKIISGNCKNDSGGMTDLEGTIELRSNCRVRGTFTQKADGFSSSCEIIATLGADKHMAGGVGECDNISIFLVNLIKR